MRGKSTKWSLKSLISNSNTNIDIEKLCRLAAIKSTPAQQQKSINEIHGFLQSIKSKEREHGQSVHNITAELVFDTDTKTTNADNNQMIYSRERYLKESTVTEGPYFIVSSKR